MLEIDDDIKKKLFLIIEEEEDSDSKSDSDTISNYESNEEFINLAQASETDSSIDCNYNGAFCFCDNKSIRVISKDSLETLFATIEHISDNEAK